MIIDSLNKALCGCESKHFFFHSPLFHCYGYGGVLSGSSCKSVRLGKSEITQFSQLEKGREREGGREGKRK